jgi:predicted N-acetyltransferase YhbS
MEEDQRPPDIKKGNLLVRIISAEETHALRWKVLWPHLKSKEDCRIDIDNRIDALHLGAFDEHRLACIGSFFQSSCPKISFKNQVRLRAMATDPEHRLRRAGELLISEAVHLLKQRGEEVIWCDARLGATGFYSRVGFQKLEEIYDVPLIGPHQFMWKELQ